MKPPASAPQKSRSASLASFCVFAANTQAAEEALQLNVHGCLVVCASMWLAVDVDISAPGVPATLPALRRGDRPGQVRRRTHPHVQRQFVLAAACCAQQLTHDGRCRWARHAHAAQRIHEHWLQRLSPVCKRENRQALIKYEFKQAASLPRQSLSARIMGQMSSTSGRKHTPMSCSSGRCLLPDSCSFPGVCACVLAHSLQALLQ